MFKIIENIKTTLELSITKIFLVLKDSTRVTSTESREKKELMISVQTFISNISN